MMAEPKPSSVPAPFSEPNRLQVLSHTYLLCLTLLYVRCTTLLTVFNQIFGLQGSTKPAMASPLTIRNLTSTPVELISIGRSKSPATKRSKNPIKAVGKLAASTTNNTTTRKASEGDAESYAEEEVSIHIEPFQSARTTQQATERLPKDIRRLIILIQGQKYRIDIHLPKPASLEFTPLNPDPRFELTAVFLPEQTHLSIYSSADLSIWMSHHADDIPISLLSIPGTHNSPTYHKALPSVRCQAVPPRQQLDNGIRFFDIRVQPDHSSDLARDALKLVHGVFPISLTGAKYLHPVLHDIEFFLDAHPSETVILSLKREGPGEATDQHLSKILHTHYAHDPARWWTEPRIPRLGDVRGKIVLLRRFTLHDDLKSLHEGRGWGIDAENWADNSACHTHGDICIQDFYQVLETANIETKIRYSQEHLERAALLSCSPFLSEASQEPAVREDGAEDERPFPPLHLNFLSASNFWRQGCWPDRIAKRLNPAVTRYLCMKHGAESESEKEGDGGTGVVIMDWVGDGGDWDLVRCVVGMNARLLMKQLQYR
jgi:1-phosphatidylinositol phosphodiesterase